MSLKLRDLIRQVRACKTAAEERAVIAKESAMIRTAIREEQEHYRHRNVAKLLFMHMLGYPTHFGQLECLKLIASPHFPEKRIGYLGMMLLLSEEADVLMLATNSLKNDMNSDNKFVAGLSLCTIGNLATADMSRDLATEVEKHLKSSTPYLRKKACLSMTRCLVKCPDMADDFVERLSTLLKDRSHGVLITVVQLMTQVIMNDEELNPYDPNTMDEEDMSVCRAALLKLVPTLVKLLRNLLGKGYAPEMDVAGVSDPFLQVQILTLLRLLGAKDENASEEMNDVLAQVATNTDSSKNAGNAILYECVQTIMAIDSEESLRVLAVNILGRFLLNRDNNIRYVALNVLAKCVKEGVSIGEDSPNSASSALQRHRSTVVECLKDPDISIRQRALELIYHLVNQENVEALVAELLNYLVLCPREHRGEICSRILQVVEKFSPNDRWRADTLITMLTIAGRECDRDVQNAAINFISMSNEDLRAYSVHKLLKAIRDDDGSQRGLLIVGIWCIGEYGDLLLQSYSYNSANEVGGDSEPITISFMPLVPVNIVTTVEDITKYHNCPEEVRLRALTCFAKLSERFSELGNGESVQQLLKELLSKYNSSGSLELQLRSCEFGALIGGGGKGSTSDGGMLDLGVTGDSSTFASAAKEALAKMPVVDISIMQKNKQMNNLGEGSMAEMTNIEAKAPVASGSNEPNLLDLDDIFGGGEPAPAASTTANTDGTNKPVSIENRNGTKADELLAPAASPPETKQNDLDLLADIFSAPPAAAPAPAALAPASYDPFSGAATPTTPSLTQTPPQPTITKISAFNKSGLEIIFECRKLSASRSQSEVTAKFKNSADDAIYGLNFQCAVPKYITMEMLPPSSTTVPISGVVGTKEVTQVINVDNSMIGTKSLMMKLKISFTLKGKKMEFQQTCNSFPTGDF